VTGFDPRTRRHEQFAGFWDLEPAVVRDLAEPPIAADVLLGAERCRQLQIIKQPDVLMLHHVLPASMPDGSLDADLDYYLPRTAHGSSLSPAICAALLARAGRPDDALDLFHLAGGIDLDDLTGTTALGLHFAAMGGLWQAVVSGFAGVSVTGRHLVVRPRLPARWERLRLTVRHRGALVRLDIDHTRVVVSSERPRQLIVDGEAVGVGVDPTTVPLRRRP
jgi:trehalose/maltose hydrolase-like predicted phosphorylase